MDLRNQPVLAQLRMNLISSNYFYRKKKKKWEVF